MNKQVQKYYMYDMSFFYVTVLKLQLCKYEFKLGSAYLYIVFVVIVSKQQFIKYLC